MKAKVNLVEDKPKHKSLNPKGKKFKKTHHSHSSSFKPKLSNHKPAEEPITCLKCFHHKKEPFRPAAKYNGGNFNRMEETLGTRLIW